MNVALADGAHACHLFTGHNEQKEVILPFFRDGLSAGECCFYISTRQSVDDWLFEFQAYGVDVADSIERGALTVISGEEWRRTGDFNSVLKAREAWDLIAGHLGEFPAVRLAGDAAWALDPPLPADQLCHWEATANLVFQGVPVRVICQYDLNLHSPAALHSALRTHPLAILAGRVVPNPYCEADRILAGEPHLNHSPGDSREVGSMLARLRGLAG